ncbi:PNPLA domain-containing protein [Caenorhabditis elegans]|uniref:PNPLA domain-containing protein n=1 Tax=Caenorhabditis elegans TaxID=6239 RepID=Q8MXR3_CAEEL|nr:PNPLA domain-containing protein [Caenorhabditis elegans]CCD74151.1 PNPLA domain-containing protein [Caenorhabditis elegans]|eukprot:NP_500969.1 Intracelllar PhosphoLipase A family [Caenorhabditis elegans]
MATTSTLIHRTSLPLLRRHPSTIDGLTPERPFFSSSNTQGGASAPPGSSATISAPGASAATVPTSYGYISNMFKNFVSKVENPLNYLSVGTSKTIVGDTVKVESKTQIIQKSNENRVSRSEVTAKTRALVKKILISETSTSRLTRIRDLSEHIMQFPPTRMIAAQEQKLIAELLEMVIYGSNDNLKEEARQCLTLIGVHPSPKGKGVHVLSIDGGGTRGMMGLEVLEKIEKLSGKKICELFDMICGVSTGSIIAALLTAKGYSVKECREVYMDVSKRLFSQGKFQGSMGLILKHSYYNTNLWISILKQMIGEDITMINTSRKLHTPRLAIVSSIVNLPTIQPYIFRNYDHPAGRDSHYRGGADHCLWTAIQASAAAPLYFSEVKLDNLLLQDGGVYANNPTAIAYHEAKLLWPDENVNCVVSVGNGRTVTSVEPTPTVFSTSFQDKLLRIIDSATDTEGVHMNVHDMLPESVYYRFNPYMTYAYGLDEIDQERLEQMASDAEFYVRRNSNKLEAAAERLLLQPNLQQRAHRCAKEWMDLKGFYKPA